MNRLNLIASVAIGACLVGLMSTPSYARRATVTETTPRSDVMNAYDQRLGKDVMAASAPTAGQDVAVIEKIRFRNQPGLCLFCSNVHNTDYFIQRSLTATWVSGLHRWVLHDADDDWYSFQAGSIASVQLGSKPSYDRGVLYSMIGAADSRRLLSVSNGGSVGNGGQVLTGTYGYTHVEALDNVTYTMTESVPTTYVPEQSASFAEVSGQIWSVDTGGHVAYHSERPWTNRGVIDASLGSNDAAARGYPVVEDGGGNFYYRTFKVTTTYVHEEHFQRVQYALRSSELATRVQLNQGSAFMAWIGGTEYQLRSGSSTVERLSEKPVVDLGMRTYSQAGDDSTVSVSNVVGSNPVFVTLRYTFQHDTGYVLEQYYVDRVATATYRQNLSLWTVRVDGSDYVVAFSGDDTSAYSGNVVHAPSSMTRPQYSVDGTGGAVVPGVPHDGSAPTGNSCIKGVNCPEPDVTPSGNTCIKGVNCPEPDVTPSGNTCIKGVTC
jgi:hypothetical protein